ncbi:hypothetical protein LSH36_45g06046 [Paralvinella palmiformis]|uniref:Uncharacterized protein n=1 Tax=Paralvinella palmiformis TaxID=53620 RepID=A0AAD9NDA7_9ANNE|nr:hypothetical protein LSH36_45g06046 [Paralvinella palmiformis]
MIVIAYMIVIPGTIKRLKREELVTLYKERMAELKKLNDQNRKIQDILDPLGDVLEEVQVPFDCFGYASQDLASAIEKCLKKYDKRYVIVQKCLFAGSVIEQLVIANQRASVAQQHIQSQRKYYENTPLEKMWDKIKVFNRNIEQAESQLKIQKKKIEDLREAYNKAKATCICFRYAKYKKMIEVASSYD